MPEMKENPPLDEMFSLDVLNLTSDMITFLVRSLFMIVQLHNITHYQEVIMSF
jgi:hypothetical protein